MVQQAKQDFLIQLKEHIQQLQLSRGVTRAIKQTEMIALLNNYRAEFRSELPEDKREETDNVIGAIIGVANKLGTNYRMQLNEQLKLLEDLLIPKSYTSIYTRYPCEVETPEIIKPISEELFHFTNEYQLCKNKKFTGTDQVFVEFLRNLSKSNRLLQDKPQDEKNKEYRALRFFLINFISKYNEYNRTGSTPAGDQEAFERLSPKTVETLYRLSRAFSTNYSADPAKVQMYEYYAKRLPPEEVKQRCVEDELGVILFDYATKSCRQMPSIEME
ncbi:MAG: hypothetical protein FWC68_04260 [Oscillospiraceae bacterium]|nr:hypothetical protein [Oscillospiraceae bacterium]